MGPYVRLLCFYIFAYLILIIITLNTKIKSLIYNLCFYFTDRSISYTGCWTKSKI